MLVFEVSNSLSVTLSRVIGEKMEASHWFVSPPY